MPQTENFFWLLANAGKLRGGGDRGAKSPRWWKYNDPWWDNQISSLAVSKISCILFSVLLSTVQSPTLCAKPLKFSRHFSWFQLTIWNH